MCWDEKTCFSFPQMTHLNWPLKVDYKGILESGSMGNPMKDATLIEFRYCTGDIFVGSHVARYGKRQVNHVGRRNLELAFAFLKERGFDFEKFQDVTLYGESAGAFGMLLNMDLFESYFKNIPVKRVISDSPGVHFKSTIWENFDEEYIRDFERAYSRIRLRLDRDGGWFSEKLVSLCSNFHNWTFGILQGSKDFVMAKLFGKMSPEEFQRRVFSSRGIYEQLKDPGDNCSAWIPESYTHVFLSDKKNWYKSTKDHFSARKYLSEILDSSRLDFPSHK